MSTLNSFTRILRQLRDARQQFAVLSEQIDDQKILTAQSLVNQIKSGLVYDSIHQAEFKVFSQFGDDGIIQYLITHSSIGAARQKFIEFGVENYQESNTRFLLVNNNWSGLVIDGSRENIDSIRNGPLYWRHDLTAVHSFVDRTNINETIAAHGFAGEVGLLSIDIDGNDYWIWESIEVVDPVIVIVEYNSILGSERAVVVPYDPVFNCTRAHYSNLFWGCSLKALCLLADKKGYEFVGADSHGNNAYFVARNRLGKLKPTSVEAGYVRSKFRESRDQAGRLTYVSGNKRLEIIQDLEVYDLEKGALVRLKELVNPA